MSKQQPIILAFDTALSGITIALNASDGRIITRQIETAREQASLLVPMLQDVLKEGGISFQDLDALACTTGPGSFTGVRIGMTTLKTLGLTLNKPVLGINTLDLMAHHYQPDGDLLIVLETKRQDFYACYYDADLKSLCEPFADDAEIIINQVASSDFCNMSIGGDCLNRFKDCVSFEGKYLENIPQPNPEILSKFALQRFFKNSKGDKPKPLYLRGADTSKPKNLPRKLEKSI